MEKSSTLVFGSDSPIHVGGLTLAERAVLIAARAGLEPVRVWGPRPLDAAATGRLRSRGVFPVQLTPASSPLQGVDRDESVLVIGPNVLVEPAALTDLVLGAGRDDGGRAHLVREAGVPVLALLAPDAVAELRSCTSFVEIATAIASRGPASERTLEGRFYRSVDREELAGAAEREYVQHTNGGATESFFTKIIRRFSVPLSRRMVRIGARPTQVTLAGFALAGAAAWSLAQGTYVTGLAGAALYYTSMIFDCSDGEVARLTLRDSAFGAWLETIVDYATYFLVLAGLTFAIQGRPGADAYMMAALLACAGSIVVMAAAGYLRHRVAARNPGQFDESSAHALASASPVHRFARWSRQWIKRSSVAHLLLALALVNQLPWFLYLWAFGASVASVVILVVGPFVARRVVVPPIEVRRSHVLR